MYLSIFQSSSFFVESTWGFFYVFFSSVMILFSWIPLLFEFIFLMIINEKANCAVFLFLGFPKPTGSSVRRENKSSSRLQHYIRAYEHKGGLKELQSLVPTCSTVFKSHGNVGIALLNIYMYIRYVLCILVYQASFLTPGEFKQTSQEEKKAYHHQITFSK